MKSSKKRKLWVMHSGPDGKAHSSFVKMNHVSLGWNQCGDLRQIPDTQKTFRKQFRSHYPNHASAAVRLKASELYRFLHKMAVGNVVVYPSGKDGLVRVGRVVGEYDCKHKNQPHCHVRKVKWFKKVQRNKLPSRVRRALSGRPSLYQPRKYASDVRKALLGDVPS